MYPRKSCKHNHVRYLDTLDKPKFLSRSNVVQLKMQHVYATARRCFLKSALVGSCKFPTFYYYHTSNNHICLFLSQNISYSFGHNF